MLSSSPQLSSFYQALKAANLSRVPGNEVTLFAPTDQAFSAAVMSGQLFQLLASGPGSSDPGAAAAGGSAGPPGSMDQQQQTALEGLLLDLIAPGRWTTDPLGSLASSGNGSLLMASGHYADVTRTGAGRRGGGGS